MIIHSRCTLGDSDTESGGVFLSAYVLALLFGTLGVFYCLK